MKKAFIDWKRESGPHQRAATLRGGAKGSGKLLKVVTYWPRHRGSVDDAYEIFQEVAAREGYEIIGSDHDEA